ncbi:MAG: hypothetical protein AAGG01_24390 [Planctomycetota bacterium]
MKLYPLLWIPVALAACGEAQRPVSLTVWHGTEQRVGHLGDAQDDFNLMGVASGNEFTYSLNGSDPVPFTVAFEPFGFRRLGAAGHFNLDIAVADLREGPNEIEIQATSGQGAATARATVTRELEGGYPLPATVRWSEVEDLQSVGQMVDGKWEITDGGLRSREPLYDRLFLIGNRAWHDYEIATTVTVHTVPDENAPMSGGSGVGFIFRFAGHSVEPPRFPEAQPKWGYQPFGAITWLRWSKSDPGLAPVRQFYRGDRDESKDAGPLASFQAGETYGMRASCQTSPEDPTTTLYRLRVWPASATEPDGWDYQIEQTSDAALRSGGVALVAHHVDVTFGDVSVRATAD